MNLFHWKRSRPAQLYSPPKLCEWESVCCIVLSTAAVPFVRDANGNKNCLRSNCARSLTQEGSGTGSAIMDNLEREWALLLRSQSTMPPAVHQKSWQPFRSCECERTRRQKLHILFALSLCLFVSCAVLCCNTPTITTTNHHHHTGTWWNWRCSTVWAAQHSTP